ncbi:hypothetical protein CK203_008818 [Vitis vinifera]|uniref:Uncharacterized protein n=1 Tax=Vitis vinifera TaxID=29760 RepID=A0A438KD06_VITVI|nr:hypothetical protein CK203_008818 [Vitis vinifera]
MESSAPLSTLVLILFLSCFAVTATAAQTQWRPGFSIQEAEAGAHPSTGRQERGMAEDGAADIDGGEATAQDDSVENVFHGLLKQTSAALINSYARKGFPYSAWEVKTLLIQALVSEEAAALQAEHFSIANEACN